MKIVGMIPARLHSTRLPRKLLLNVTGKPLLQYVWETACECPEFHDVVVATDSQEIVDVVHSFGGRAELTGQHNSGTDRIAEVTRRVFPDADAIVNLQGDEPELDPKVVSALVRELKSSGAEMATVAAPILSAEVVKNPNCVKVVTDVHGKALYFSRSPIPFSRDVPVEDYFRDGEPSPWLLHIGLYAYRRDFLLRLTSLPPSPLEQIEKLEQLRALQCGASIGVAVVNHSAAGIDTPEDYAAFVHRQEQKTQIRRAA
ncbi:MAG: 3-deoxy-manno-octulosonate cytidylyltransferase [Planctomycetaceae bacterium]|nr:3-deoxy-manno-octulosonate cytidylyltransferase [Planctomycetaceae bacterium]